MVRKILLLTIFLFFVSCKLNIVDNYTHEDNIDKYFNDKYKSELLKNDIKIIKCVILDDKIVPMYYDKYVVNTYNPLIYIKYVNDKHGYAVYFDISYKFKNKNDFINDLDKCLKNVNIIEENKKSWK